jgi:hypothetical protein
VVDKADHVVAEKRLPKDIEEIVGLIKPWQAELPGVEVESTFNWYWWLVHGLKVVGFTVNVAYTTAIKKYAARRYIGDPITSTELKRVAKDLISEKTLGIMFKIQFENLS